MTVAFEDTISLYRLTEWRLREFIVTHHSEEYFDRLVQMEDAGMNVFAFLSQMGQEEPIEPLDSLNQAVLAWGSVRILLKRLEMLMNVETITTEKAASLIYLSGIVSSLAGRVVPLAPVADVESYARKFLEPKDKKSDDLTEILTTIVRDYLEENKELPDYMQVVRQLSRLSHVAGGGIQEVDNGAKLIYWRRSNGKECKTSFKQLRERLTNIRKNLVSPVKPEEFCSS